MFCRYITGIDYRMPRWLVGDVLTLEGVSLVLLVDGSQRRLGLILLVSSVQPGVTGGCCTTKSCCHPPSVGICFHLPTKLFKIYHRLVRKLPPVG
jgi:hypothetical protein